MAGRSEEDIMSMGNWTSGSAAERNIEDSMLTKKKNGEGFSIPGYKKPEIVKYSSSKKPETEIPSTETTIVTQKKPVTDVVPVKNLDPDTESPCRKRAKFDAISFNGAIDQIVVVSGSDSILHVLKK